MAAPDVALVGLYPPLGARHEGRSGVSSYTANLAHALAGAGAAVTVVADRLDGEPDLASDDGVRVRRSFRRGARALAAAVRAAAGTGAPVVHVQHELFLYGGASSVPALVPALLASRRPTVVTLHQVVDPATVDRDFTALHRVRAPVTLARTGLAGLQAAVARLADAVIVHEPAFAAVVPGARVVPHGIERAATPTRAAARAAVGIAEPDERLVALCFGFLAPYKGLESVVAAAPLAGDGVRVVVAGGEHPRLAAAGDDFARALRAAPGGGAVTFTGRVPAADVASWFAAADVALFAYPRPFSSSGALALALAHRTPLLLSPELARCTGAPPEAVVARDPASLARRLRALAADRRRLDLLRDAAAALAADRDWSAVAARHLDVYGEVIADAARGPRGCLRAAQPR